MTSLARNLPPWTARLQRDTILGGSLGGGVGLVIGLFVGHPVLYAFGIGFVGSAGVYAFYALLPYLVSVGGN